MTHRDTFRRPLIVAGLAVLTTAIVGLAVRRNTFFDIRVYWGAVSYWFRDGGMVYDWVKVPTEYGFTYPPFAGLVMLPMAMLSQTAAVVVAATAVLLSTAVLTWWLVGPAIRRAGWPAGYSLAVALCLVIAFEPVRETFSFGQVNTLLMLLVAGDLLFGVARGRRWGGVGVGLATAVKLTPGVFIVYLLVTGRWRAAATAAGAATAATLLSAAVAPEASREFWTAALWNTDRVGNLAYVSNQSLRGLVARQLAGPAESTIWLLLVLAALAVWVWRARAAAAAGDEFGGLAVTGVLGCLISPVSWVHHLVWLLPALIRVLDVGWFAPRGSRGRWLLYAGVAGYLLVTSRLTFVWETAPRPPLAVVGSNLYVWLSIGLLLAMPIRSRTGLPPTGPPPTGPPPTGPPPGGDLPGGDLSVGGASIPVDGRI